MNILNWSIDNRFVKGGDPVGTIRSWSDGKKHQKQSDGSWKEMSEGSKEGKKEEATDKVTVTKRDRDSLSGMNSIEYSNGVKMIINGSSSPYKVLFVSKNKDVHYGFDNKHGNIDVVRWGDDNDWYNRRIVKEFDVVDFRSPSGSVIDRDFAIMEAAKTWSREAIFRDVRDSKDPKENNNGGGGESPNKKPTSKARIVDTANGIVVRLSGTATSGDATYIGDNGEEGEYNDAKFFDSKAEAKIALEKYESQKSDGESSIAKKKRNMAIGFLGAIKKEHGINPENLQKLISKLEDKSLGADEVLNSVKEKAPKHLKDRISKLMNSKDYVKTEDNGGKFDNDLTKWNKVDQTLIGDVNNKAEWMNIDIVQEIKQSEKFYDYDIEELTPAGEKEFISRLKKEDPQGYESWADEIKQRDSDSKPEKSKSKNPSAGLLQRIGERVKNAK